VPLLALRRALALTGGGLHQPGLDAELAEAQALVHLQLDLRPRQQGIVVAAGVLEQVAGKLLAERALVAFDPLVVGRREPDGVLVGNVDARNGGGSVGVHLLGQLARDLDRLHLRREGATEDPFDEALDARFKVSQDADG